MDDILISPLFNSNLYDLYYGTILGNNIKNQMCKARVSVSYNSTVLNSGYDESGLTEQVHFPVAVHYLWVPHNHFLWLIKDT